MKKLVFLFLIVSFSFVGCIDVFESISAEGENVNIMMNITLSKATIELVNSMNSEEIDYKEIFSEQEMKKHLPENAKAKFIDTDYEVGISVSVSVKQSDIQNIKEDSFGIPKKQSSYYIIPISLEVISKEDTENTDAEMTLALFSAHKYKLVISKSFIDKIQSVEMVVGDKASRITFYDIEDGYLIDIPLSFLMLEGAYLKIS